MGANTQDMLAEVFSEVAEKMAFMFTDVPEEHEFPTDLSHALEAKMTFSGPFSGGVELVVPMEMCMEIAGNFLGLDPDDDLLTEAAAHDALKEMLNVTCGHVLTAMAGEKPIFDLSVPEVAPLEAEAWRKLRDDPHTCALLVDDNPVLLHLTLDK